MAEARMESRAMFNKSVRLQETEQNRKKSGNNNWKEKTNERKLQAGICNEI